MATRVLCGLLRGTSVLGATVCTFGCAYSWLALYVYGGSKLATREGESNNVTCEYMQTCIISISGAQLLRLYCCYILLLALNGISECFLFATLVPDAIAQHRRFLTKLAVVYISMQLALSTLLGAPGFVLANCINMIARIVYR